MNDANEMQPVTPTRAGDDTPSVDAVLRAAASRQRRALTPTSEDAAPQLILHRDGAADHPPTPMPAAGRRWRGVLAAAAAVALLVGGWWALSVTTDTVSSDRPIATDTPDPAARGINALLDGARAALNAQLNLPALRPTFPAIAEATNSLDHLTADDMTQPLADELNRMRSDVRRVLADLPRVSLRWDKTEDGEPRTDRAKPPTPSSA